MSTLSCCYIIKNEQDFIIDSLNKMFYIADEVVIVDTGSTDNTHKLVDDWILKNKLSKVVKFLKVDGMFNDEDGDFHFGNAKSYAFDNASCDYVMWLDAADIIHEPKKLKKTFRDVIAKEKQVYFVINTKVSENTSFPRTRITPRKNSKMVGRVHEYMHVSSNLKKCVIKNEYIINRRNADSLDRNLRLLLKEWKESPNNRVAFYIANTYYGMGDKENALEWFIKRATQFLTLDKKINEEKFKSLEMICDLSLRLYYKTKNEKYRDDILKAANDLISYNPNRYEGWYYKGKYFMEIGLWDKALRNLEMYPKCKQPGSVILWLNPQIYKNNTYLAEIELCKVTSENIKKGVLVPDEIIELSSFNFNSINPGRKNNSYTTGKTLYL